MQMHVWIIQFPNSDEVQNEIAEVSLNIFEKSFFILIVYGLKNISVVQSTLIFHFLLKVE